MRDMLFDLHTHTNCSDGSLSPAELAAYALFSGVDVLAITDHDTVAAFSQLDDAGDATPQLVTGIELSCLWQRRLIHVVGLKLDLASDTLTAAIEQQLKVRLMRAETIAKRLEKLGVANPLDDVLERSGGNPGRPHFAAHLVDIGFVKDQKTAFRHYLGAGKIGDVKESWPSIETAVGWVVAAGGQAVLAHPVKYKLTKTKLRELVSYFRQAGGVAIEVCSGSQDPATTSALARIINEAGLLASAGSDFHHRSQSWSQPGRYAPLPSGVTPLWDTW
ncbi:MAG: PHP domain-containing protein [Woeseiaceae bacterium]|nr:PHP domain-containing protein [Woeseiaceae bacterium]